MIEICEEALQAGAAIAGAVVAGTVVTVIKVTGEVVKRLPDPF